MRICFIEKKSAIFNDFSDWPIVIISIYWIYLKVVSILNWKILIQNKGEVSHGRKYRKEFWSETNT